MPTIHGHGILRSNFRFADTAAFGNALIGSAIVQGSFLPGAASGQGGASFLGGGWLMGSFASQLSGAGFWAQSTFGVMSAFYGSAAFTSGYKFIPVAFMDYSGDGASHAMFYALSATGVLGSQDSVFVVTPKAFTISGPVTSASNVSVRFVFGGWIVSTPI